MKCEKCGTTKSGRGYIKTGKRAHTCTVCLGSNVDKAITNASKRDQERRKGK